MIDDAPDEVKPGSRPGQRTSYGLCGPLRMVEYGAPDEPVLVRVARGFGPVGDA